MQSIRKLSGFRVRERLENRFHQLPPLYPTLPTVYATLREPSDRLSTTFNKSHAIHYSICTSNLELSPEGHPYPPFKKKKFIPRSVFAGFRAFSRSRFHHVTSTSPCLCVHKALAKLCP
ncbi:hypothetical protein CROQUDRAFT_175289 [Cronartium quercuum f. sp. fusiforme G11]|uniref:Uncharacterized protein n=1 Tax=Cronartium quercuum f. sp. fusiforme G11 TaxID=708437 RepID=A0A9P6NNQ6_9BASI|nr:hypothetical protein CROQUDRAFT_175289 [Cronartium quercuum f. sp. fusiforme G11]